MNCLMIKRHVDSSSGENRKTTLVPDLVCDSSSCHEIPITLCVTSCTICSELRKHQNERM